MIKLIELMPKAPDFLFNWPLLLNSEFRELLLALSNIPQNARWHAEGNVFTHVKMVCDHLAGYAEFRALPQLSRAAVSIAAILHDVGKIATTTIENGVPLSPGHSLAGSHVARKFLITRFNLSGSAEKTALRESVCSFIRYHTLPFYLQNQPDAEKQIIKTAAIGSLAKEFSIKNLCLLAQADMEGRVFSERDEWLARIEHTRRAAQEAGCFAAPRAFESDAACYDYLSGRQSGSWGEVIMLSGLPGAGKDQWINKNAAQMKLISMDELRRQMHVKPDESRTNVSRAAQELARAYLRAHTPFIWNATNLSESTRRRIIRLFENYGASVRVVYLETDWQKTLQSCRQRASGAPESALNEMLCKFSPPDRNEAERVIWEFT